MSSAEQGAILSQGIATIIFVFGIYLVIRFYTTLVLGVSLSQWLLGLRGVGNATWKRIGGGARVVLEVLLRPLVLGELLLLTRRPSLKEVLSHTRIVSTNKKMSLYAGLVWVPGLLIFSTISPLFEGLTLMDGITVSPVKENLNLKGQGSYKKFSNFKSNRFKFRAFSSLSDGRFLLLPSFEVVKEGSSKKIKPYLWLYDHKSKRDAFIKIEQRFSLLSLLEKGQLGNPLFESQFPDLTKTLSKSREELIKKKYRKEFEDEKILNEKTRNDIENLVKASLGLGAGNVLSHLLSYGPFLRGFVSIKNELVGKTFKGVSPEVDFGKVGSHTFLRFKQLFAEKVFFDKRMVETYIPIETNNSLVLRFYWGEDLSSALSRKTFRESFLQSMVWYFDYFNIFSFPEKSDDVNSLTILDHFTKTDLKLTQRENLEEAIFRMYFKLGRRSLQSEDVRLQDILLTNLNRIYLVSTYINDSKNNYYSKKFLVHLRDLRFSLKNKDLKYFGLEN